MATDLLQRKKVVGGAPTGGPLTAGGGATAQSAPVQPRASPGFVSFDRFFQANQQGAQSMANQVGSKVEESGQKAATGLNAAQEQWDDAREAGTLAYDPAKAPDAATAKQLATTTYTGPKDWSAAGIDMAGLTKDTTAAAGQATALGSAGGVANLLRESYRSGPTTAGGSAWDAALTSAAGGGRFAQLRELYGGLDKALTDAAKLSGEQYENAVESTEGAAKQYGELAAEYEKQAQAEAEERAKRERAKRRNIGQMPSGEPGMGGGGGPDYTTKRGLK